MADAPSIACPRCGKISYHPKDIEQGYCGHCHDWTSAAARAYRDDRYPERRCDHCDTPYRGPAVYCSLECAQADA